MITLEIPFTLEGSVVQSHIDSPYGSLLQPIPEYRVELLLDDPTVLDDLGLLFDQHSSDHINTWLTKKGTLRACSVIKPLVSKDGRRTTEGLVPGESVLLRCKAVLNDLPNGYVSAVRILYVSKLDVVDDYTELTSLAEEKYGQLNF